MTTWPILIEPEHDLWYNIMRRARLDRGWSQLVVVAKLAAMDVHITQTNLSGYEKGKRTEPREDVLHALGRLYDLPEDRLVPVVRRSSPVYAKVPQRSYAVPDQPGMLEVLRQLPRLNVRAKLRLAEAAAQLEHQFPPAEEQHAQEQEQG